MPSARLYLDNFANMQSSWVTQGLKIGQLALLYGANDMGSLMIEENVVAEAGTVHYLTLDEIRGAIRELGFIPRQRNVFYELIDEDLPDSLLPTAQNPANIAAPPGHKLSWCNHLLSAFGPSGHAADLAAPRTPPRHD